MASESGDRTRQRIAAVVLVVVVALIAGGIAWTVLGRSGDGQGTAAPAPSVAAPTAPAEPQAVVLVAVNTPQDDFTPPMGEDAQEITAIAADSPTGLTDVTGGEVGLYGGTLELGSCDRDQLATYLEEHPNKAAAWAEVRGVPVSEIRAHLSRLTPLILRTDTLVTNHGYVDGVATAFPSVLQAGTAVLVDDYGVPAVRCYCGNPLTAAPDLAPGSTFEGKTWKGWKPERLVRITPADEVIDNFTAVDVATDSLFTRPAGTSGAQDAATGQPAPAGVAGVVVDPGPLSGVPAATSAPSAPPASEPAAEAPAEPAAGERPPGEPQVLFEVTSIAGVSSGPPEPTVFTLDRPAYLTSIFTYHYFNEGAPPGTIGLQSEDGTTYGPWPATGTEGQAGVPNANWYATPNTTVPAGTYTIVDSDPETWSWTFDTDRRGIAIVEGIPVSGGAG